MALWKHRRPGNAEGDFYVDSSCIDCDLCRQISPGVFQEEGGQSVVGRQPTGPRELLRTQMALVTCPTGSIGTVSRPKLDPAIAAYPEAVDQNVHFCGFASAASYGGSSYLIVRPEGNVLVDSPRFTRPLVRRLEEMGGVRLLFLSHADDVADHERFRSHFGCERIMHEADLSFPVERPVRGSEPVTLASDLVVVPTPGHTEGHLALLHRETHLFTGDHLWWDPERGALGASRSYCWYSWEEQRRSMERLLAYSFEWILPGHGQRHRASRDQMRQELRNLIARMGRAPVGPDASGSLLRVP
jgi:glyoxylase-like metal-dependent hydrolase (beta-lactamase superfamily II)/ferredoxin